MINYPIVEPLQPEPDGDYDVVVGTIGFEERARFLAETMRPKGKKMVAIGFRRQQVLNYLVNEEWYSTHGYETTDLEDGEYGDFCSELVAQLDFRNDEPPRMWVDISSCSRLRLALLIDAIRRAAHPIVVDFVYSISKFSAPSTMRLGNTHVGPVTPNYAGWAVEPN